ncbi:hypothetical protein KJ973_00570 [Patescibacteria group bacterium]|nr:hypothetical protein [Patescibacteria group bacterium]MBU1519180.1 hypothetical protein [Patescibacteria group bacterium]MBU2416592.1 hypothetical protein [Patescibacteria group bacterium]
MWALIGHIAYLPLVIITTVFFVFSWWIIYRSEKDFLLSLALWFVFGFLYFLVLYYLALYLYEINSSSPHGHLAVLAVTPGILIYPCSLIVVVIIAIIKTITQPAKKKETRLYEEKI